MKVRLQKLEVVTRKATETVVFAKVTFLHGPVGSGKSTVARLVDFCFGADLVETPAIQSEFVAARLFAILGDHEVVFERERASAASVRVTWQEDRGVTDAAVESQTLPPLMFSVLAPLHAERGMPLLDGLDGVENLSDLIFHLTGTQPIRVRQSKRDPDARLVRLGFRDLLFYCYLDQDGLDSSFFALDHPFKRPKSMDAMRFIVGLHSERMNDLEQRLARAQEDQRTKRAIVTQLEHVLKELDFDNDLEVAARLEKIVLDRAALRKELASVEDSRKVESHPLDQLRARLRELNTRSAKEEESLGHLREKLEKREALRAELVTAKLKALRADAAQRVIGQVAFERCPQCETPTESQRHPVGHCSLCGQLPASSFAYEALASEFDARVDDLEDLVARQKREVTAQELRVRDLRATKEKLDAELDVQARTYDAAFIARLRELERSIAELDEREKNLKHLRRIPASLERLTREAGELQGDIDAAKKGIEQERQRLNQAQTVVQTLQVNFREILLRVGFPGMSKDHDVVVDMHTWEPRVFAGKAAWGFEELGSGGKKVLFKVLYALALHELAAKQHLPLPTFLLVDSPTKNISHDVNPELFEAFYKEVYRVAAEHGDEHQFILIDSELVRPPDTLPGFDERLLDHSSEHPPLISYYKGL